MNQKIVENVIRISSEILQDERIKTSKNFNFNDAENMDSINRVAIITTLEDEYGFIFKLKEISAWNTILELAEIIENKLQ